MAQIFFLAIAFYLGYRLVFNFILPVYKTSKHVRTQFRNMQDNMQNNSQQSYNGYQQPRQEPPRTRPEQNRADDYIDFEEVK